MVSVRPTAVAVCAAVAAAVVYATMWLGQGWLDTIDSSSLTVLYDVAIKHPGWTRFWRVVCTVFSPTAFRLLAAPAVVVALARRRVRAAVFLVVSVELSGVVTEVAKGLADRPRPATALVAEASSSFPSGHALAAMVGVLTFGVVLWPLPGHRLGVVAAAMGALIVLAVGFGRVALNVHHPSDVLAGWALGYLYFAACAWALRPLAPRSAPVRADAGTPGSV